MGHKASKGKSKLITLFFSGSKEKISDMETGSNEEQPPSIDLHSLLGACVEACALGCEEVRKWEKERQAKQETKAELKDPNDVRSYVTQADLASQAAIVEALHAKWPGLFIVGEEDGAVAVPLSKKTKVHQECDEVSNGLRLAGLADEAASVVPMEHVMVLVDPVDGTRELVEGRINAVQTLIGVAVRGRAVGGVIGLNFPDGAMDSPPVLTYGLVGSGFGCMQGGSEVPLGTGSPTRATDGPLYSTGDSKNSVLLAAKEVLTSNAKEKVEWIKMGGAGNKLLAVAQGRIDAGMMHFSTSLWDTCAPEAVVKAMGGNVTDLFGSPIKYILNRPEGLLNEFGVLGVAAKFEEQWNCKPEVVYAAMRSCSTLLTTVEKYSGKSQEPKPPQAVDVARGLKGTPLSLAWLQEKLSPPNGCNLIGYSAPEESASRDLMSDVCRLKLCWDKEDVALPKSVFYKRIVMGEMEHVRMKAKHAPMKLARDVNSYSVEAGFLASQACKQIIKAGIPVPRAYAVEQDVCLKDPIESRFCLLLEDFSGDQGWKQHRLLNLLQAKSSLSAFAKLHGFFWEGSTFWKERGAASQELEASVWSSGSYWQPARQPEEQLHIVEEMWERHLQAFKESFSQAQELKNVDLPSLGGRLQSIAKKVGTSAHPFADPNAKPSAGRTLIHGDAKSANIFLREIEGNIQVGLIDFQWCGFGLAMTEVAHHIMAALDEECLSFDGSKEKILLEFYYTELMAALVKYGAASCLQDAETLLTREALQAQYEDAILDMCRVVFSYHWVRIKASPKVLVKNADSLGRNSYNKSLFHAKWLVAACDRALKFKGL